MNFFLGAGETSRRNGNNVNSANSHNRLFGDDGRSSASVKNHKQSNIPFGGGESVVTVTNDNGHATNGNKNGSFNGNGTNGHTNGNGNITHSQRNNKSETVNKGI